VIHLPAAAQPAQDLDYLPERFSAEDRAQIQELAALAVAHVQEDAESTVTPRSLHEVAQTLIKAACDARTVMIFFLSLLDVDEIEPVKKQFDADVLLAAHNVSIIRLLSGSDNPTQPPIRKVLLRQLVLKATHDVRVIIVKIAGRLVVLRHAENFPEKQRQDIAQEALDVVVPWCDALGLEEWRQEIQELSFKYLSPEKYNFVLTLMQDHRDTLYEVKDQVIQDLKTLIKKHDIEANISGRVKTHYAVYRKMEAYELQYDEVWDRVGIRILTSSVFDCYYIQTAIEEELYPERRRFVDYIETPRKPYNYQSLHLTVTGPRGTSVEIQIRTFDMHIKGEYGVAAHWKMYGGGEGADSSEDIKFAFLRTQASHLLGDPIEYLGNTLDALLFNNSILPTDTSGYVLDPITGERIKDSRGQEIYYRDAHVNDKGYILDSHTNQLLLDAAGDAIWYQSEILPDRVIVYTKDGDLRSLPQGATPLDFAYYIHENVGNSCVGAKVNKKMVRLDSNLKLGDQVEVLTRKGSKPSLDWLYNGYSKTRRAHDKIKRYFREKTDVAVPEVEELGHAIIKKRFSAHKIRDLSLERLTELLKCTSQQELLEGIGSGEITVQKLDDVLGMYLLEQLSQADVHTTHVLPNISYKEFNLHYTQAQCCLPLPGDDTISYITQGRGFTLHRADCRNVSTLDPARVAYFDWPDYMLCEEGSKPTPVFLTRLSMLVVHPSKTILYIKDAALFENLPIDSIRMSKEHEANSQIEITFRAACRQQTDRLIRKLYSSDDILMIRRPLG
jgi:(p)ppGpp synthase/HD superfamily hydrolase